MELWQPIPGFEGYDVSTEGRVRSWWTRRRSWRAHPRVLKPYKDKVDGYWRIRLLTPDGHRRQRHHVARLVCLAWRGTPAPARGKGGQWEASHLDGNPDNNTLENLIWERKSDNHKRRYWEHKHDTFKRKVVEAVRAELKSERDDGTDIPF